MDTQTNASVDINLHDVELVDALTKLIRIPTADDVVEAGIVNGMTQDEIDARIDAVYKRRGL